MRKTLAGKILSDEFRLLLLKNPLTRIDVTKPYPIPKYIPTVTPINLQGS